MLRLADLKEYQREGQRILALHSRSTYMTRTTRQPHYVQPTRYEAGTILEIDFFLDPFAFYTKATETLPGIKHYVTDEGLSWVLTE